MAQSLCAQPVYAPPHAAVAVRARASRGFSLVDLLVSVAVMVILISILMPAWQMSIESVRRAKCSVYLRQIGLATQMYADDHRGRMPAAIYGRDQRPRNGRDQRPEWFGDTMYARLPSDDGALRMASVTRSTTTPNGDRWDGLGILFNDEYLSSPEALYCPSHHGFHPQSEYSGEWLNTPGRIATNFQYRVPAESAYMHELDRGVIIIADGMNTRLDYNHSVGNNYIKADLSADWYHDVNHALLRSLPDPTGSVEVTGPPDSNGWTHLDSVGHE